MKKDLSWLESLLNLYRIDRDRELKNKNFLKVEILINRINNLKHIINFQKILNEKF